MAIVRPTRFPDWATVPSTDPIVGGPNIQEPPTNKIQKGWERKEKPPANYQNWLHNFTDQWLKFLNFGGFGLREGFCERLSNTEVKFNKVFGSGKNALQGIFLAQGLSLTKEIDVDWVEGDGEGGFPSGLTLSPNTWYHCFYIVKEDGTVDAGFDSSFIATNLLADATDYVDFLRAWSVKTDGSSNIIPAKLSILPGGQRVTYWNEPIHGSTPQSATPVNKQAGVPTGFRTLAILTAATTSPQALSDNKIRIYPTDVADGISNNDAFMGVSSGDAGFNYNLDYSGFIIVLTDDNGDFRIVTKTPHAATIAFATHGWIE